MNKTPTIPIAKEYRIGIAIPLPSGEFDHAEAMMKIKPLMAQFTEALKAFPHATAEGGVVTPKPRTKAAPVVVGKAA